MENTNSMLDTRRYELKITALNQRLSEVITSYENQVAELRVELTLVAERNEELEARLAEKEDPAD